MTTHFLLVTVSSPTKERFGIHVLFVLKRRITSAWFSFSEEKTNQLLSSDFRTWWERGMEQRLAVPSGARLGLGLQTDLPSSQVSVQGASQAPAGRRPGYGPSSREWLLSLCWAPLLATLHSNRMCLRLQNWRKPVHGEMRKSREFDQDVSLSYAASWATVICGGCVHDVLHSRILLFLENCLQGHVFPNHFIRNRVWGLLFSNLPKSGMFFPWQTITSLKSGLFFFFFFGSNLALQKWLQTKRRKCRRTNFLLCLT